jgi:hypothetical protein
MLDFRSVLEVNKFLPTADVLKGSEQVCGLWRRASTANELWTDLTERDGFIEFASNTEGKKLAYEMEIRAYRMVILEEYRITRYDCKRKKWTRQQLTMEVGKAEDMTLAMWGHIVVCCGGFRRYSAYLISFTGAVTLLPDMITPRYRHGVVVDQGQVYAFGGMNQCGLCCCEVLSLSSLQQWQRLPDMRFAHHSFSPFTVNGLVYIWGGGTPRVETFSLESRRFTVIGIEDITQCLGEQCAVVKDNQLYLVTTERKMIGSTGDFKLKVQYHRNIDKLYSQASPILYQGHLFTLWQGHIYSLNLATGHRGTAF